ncbi:Protein kinase-like domain protein [Niveomyces insectorum RCEF 264]|uniref:Protein kinase-like domain protein n=1 Tax=Niveomyces insectorum RCEF 264 TaxID=1081102 RepID=A0A167LSS4_9HYPO|nr:Protein kinase-like domain protein [Niveomyces insectorum RCEF 264]
MPMTLRSAGREPSPAGPSTLRPKKPLADQPDTALQVEETSVAPPPAASSQEASIAEATAREATPHEAPSQAESLPDEPPPEEANLQPRSVYFYHTPASREAMRSEDPDIFKNRLLPGPGDQLDEVVSVETWTSNDGSNEYVLHAHLRNDEYYHQVEDGACEKIDDERVFAPYDESLGYVVAPDELYKDAVYIKRPCPRRFHRKGELVSVDFAYEARVLDHLSRRPHPHIARYFGCRVRRGYITGLVFERLPRTLAELSPSELAGLNKDRFLAQLRSAVAFLHAQGFAHNDIKPQNIMVRDGQPVLIDFGSCYPIGWANDVASAGWTMLGAGGGDDGKIYPEFSLPENDIHVLQLLEERFADHARLTGTYRLALDSHSWELRPDGPAKATASGSQEDK